MKHRERIAGYRQLRERPLWKLLAADHAPELIGLLQGLLLDGERRLPSSVLHERLQRQLDALRADELSRELPRTAQAYVADMPKEAPVRILDERGHVRPLEEIERDLIQLAIEIYSGHMSEVARRLGIGRSTLYRKVREQGIDGAPPEEGEADAA